MLQLNIRVSEFRSLSGLIICRFSRYVTPKSKGEVSNFQTIRQPDKDSNRFFSRLVGVPPTCSNSNTRVRVPMAIGSESSRLRDYQTSRQPDFQIIRRPDFQITRQPDFQTGKRQCVKTKILRLSLTARATRELMHRFARGCRKLKDPAKIFFQI